MSEELPIIEWDDDGYPTESSLERLRQIVNGDDINKAIDAFYAALRANRWPEHCGPEIVEVRGELMEVWGYHTGGWSGNEDIINALQSSWLFNWLLQRYDSGGHYYFKRPENVLRKAGFTAGMES